MVLHDVLSLQQCCFHHFDSAAGHLASLLQGLHHCHHHLQGNILHQAQSSLCWVWLIPVLQCIAHSTALANRRQHC